MRMLNKKFFGIIFMSLIMIVLISGCTGQIQTNEQPPAPPGEDINQDKAISSPSQNTTQDEPPPSPPEG